MSLRRALAVAVVVCGGAATGCASDRGCDPCGGGGASARPGPAVAARPTSPAASPEASGPRVPAPRAAVPEAASGDELVVCGVRFPTGTRVVLWSEAGGFDAYQPRRRFEATPGAAGPADGEARYGAVRRSFGADVAARAAAGALRLEDLRAVVHQVVVHYDAAGTSARAFEVLHDRRGLSAHFLVDLDGTVYQTLDAQERAWHAGATNDASVGIELANPGAFEDRAVLDRWYTTTAEGVRLVVPPDVRRGALPEGATFAPARPDAIVGAVHGRPLVQYDFTAAQYEALARVLAALSRALPRCRLEAPRAADGTVVATTLPEGPARDAFEGLLGHWHVSAAKVDPGPAFDWDAVLARARALRDGR